MSGGWAGEAADIVPMFGKPFPLVVECKHEEGWEFDHLFSGIGVFPGWMAQAIEQADYKSNQLEVKHWPVLFFTRNRRNTYIMLPREVIELGLVGELPTHIVVGVSLRTFICGEADNILAVISYKKLETNWRLKRLIRRTHEQPETRTDLAGDNLVGRT